MDNSMGSIWSRWDLHIHTPETLKNDQYQGKNKEEKWDKYYQAIADYMGDGSNPLRTITVMGITDYVSTENYFKVKNDKRLPSCVKMILPNIEMRLSLMGEKDPINIHFLFDPEYDNQIENRFLAKLKFNYRDMPFTATKKELIRLGYTIKNSASDDEAYKIGVEQFLVDFQNLQDLFKQDPELREHVFIAVANSSTDGVSGLFRHSAEGKTKSLSESIYYFVDAIFSATPSDREYFLGKGTDNPSDIILKYGLLKPCIHGSDAHCLEKIFEPDKERYCWIKSEPSFEGLKQIIYEPEDRVIIQGTYPDKKDFHHVIRNITIEDNDFSPEPIYFNPNLTCIIGGKSTGKTLLLRQLAYSIDPVYTKSQEKEVYLQERKFLKRTPTVLWEDGTTESKEIIYIPQTFLNRVIDIPEESTAIGKMIEDTLLQNNTIIEAKQNLDDSILSIKKNVEIAIEEYFSKINELKTIDDLLKRDGTKTVFDGTIENLQMQISEFAESTDISEEEISQYLNLGELIETEKAELNSYEIELNSLNAIDPPLVVLPKYTNLSNGEAALKREFEEIFPEMHAEIQQQINNLSAFILPQWDIALNNLNDSLSEKITILKKQIDNQLPIYDQLKIKVERNDQFQRLSQQLTEEVKKQQMAEKREKEKDKLAREVDVLKKDIISSQMKIKKAYQIYVNAITSEEFGSNTSLEFDSKIVWKKQEFSALISNIFDNRGFSAFKNRTNINLTELSDEDYSVELLTELWDAMDNSHENGGLSIKNGYTKETAIQQIFSDWYNIHYIVMSGKDTMENMSPGKKALVLLELLINLGNDKCPILIDQPEDDLDNRSIYNELVQYIREKKKERQIIIVTHNANVVLGADAEEVIIANQEGSGDENEKYRFEYRSGAIEDDSPSLDEKGNILPGVLNRSGIQTQICDILEGGRDAFELRKNKYKVIRKDDNK